ncbi:MAG: HAD-IIIC family phosphatase, partial [Halioglobus sp.]|nr:HAD-IIIC family phosphatase [Halioglobus sp.]
LGIVHTYTSELLDPWLDFSAALNGIALQTYHAPYGVTVQEATANSGLARHQPDVTLLLLRPADLHPDLATPLALFGAEQRGELRGAALAALDNLVGMLRAVVSGQIIVTLLPDQGPTGLGLFDAMAEQSESAWWSDTRRAVASTLRQHSGTTLLDLDGLVTNVGASNFFDARLWYSSVFPFAPDGCLAVADAVTSLAASLKRTRAKVIVLDADNTLWGGVIGEDGMQGIALGPEYPGCAYVDFQRRVLALKQRGFVLAVCSKNNMDDFMEVLESHPHMLLKKEDFAAMRVNWTPKPDNLRALAEELNLGLDSFIFADDSDHECAAVRHALPEVEVVQVPGKPVEVAACLDHLPRLQVLNLTDEDLAKTAMYQAEAQRKSQMADLSSGGGSVQDYLKSLNMKMAIGRDDAAHLPRLAQLTQKTNQFNLTTRRYSEQDVARYIEADDATVYHFSLADNFGDSGIVGLAIVEKGVEKSVEKSAEKNASRARLDTFLMSCRVIGRCAEQAFLARIIDNLRDEGIAELEAEYIPTRKNVLVATFLPDNGFTALANGHYETQLAARDGSADDYPIDIEGPA